MSSKTNLLASVVLCAITLVYLWQAIQLPAGGATFSDVGPRLFPLILGVSLFATVLVLLVTSILGARTQATLNEQPEEDQAEVSTTEEESSYRHAGLILATIAYLVLLQPLGFLVSTVGYLAVGVLIVGGLKQYPGVKLLVPLAFSSVASLAIYLGFDWGLNVTLPPGVFAPRWW